MKLKSIDGIHVNYSADQIHHRIKTLQQRNLINVCQDGQKKILLDPHVLRVLRRLVDLEHEYNSLPIAFIILENEILNQRKSLNPIRVKFLKKEKHSPIRIRLLDWGFFKQLSSAFRSLTTWV